MWTFCALLCVLQALIRVVAASHYELLDLPVSTDLEMGLVSNDSGRTVLPDYYYVVLGHYDSVDAMFSAFTNYWPTFRNIIESEASSFCGFRSQGKMRSIAADFRRLWAPVWAWTPYARFSLYEILQRVMDSGTICMSYQSVCALLRIMAVLKDVLSNVGYLDADLVFKGLETALIRSALAMSTFQTSKRLSYACSCLWKLTRISVHNHINSLFSDDETKPYILDEIKAWCIPVLAINFSAVHVYSATVDPSTCSLATFSAICLFLNLLEVVYYDQFCTIF